jgi:hypothetical protein
MPARPLFQERQCASWRLALMPAFHYVSQARRGRPPRLLNIVEVDP